MDTVRKFALWIVAGILVLGAIGFYVVVVRGKVSAISQKMSKVTARRDDLKKEASKPEIPTRRWVEEQRKANEKIKAQAGDVEDLLRGQTRLCNTRIFFEDIRSEATGIGKQIDPEIQGTRWLGAYAQHVRALRRQIYEAGFLQWQLEVSDWGANIPSKEQIQEAQEVFWFQKDFADYITNQVVKDLEKIMNPPADQPDIFPQKPADLVIDLSASGPEEQRLDTLLQAVGKDKLATVLEAIVINDDNADLASIFDTHLRRDDFGWERVLSLTMNEAQRGYLDQLVPPPRRDLVNRKRFKDLIMELRSVRYRSDVIALLERREGFADLVRSIRTLSPTERTRIRGMIESWEAPKLAKAIAGVVSVVDEDDYNLVRDNHKIQIASIGGLLITRPESLEGERRRSDFDRGDTRRPERDDMRRPGRDDVRRPARRPSARRPGGKEMERGMLDLGAESKLYKATEFEFSARMQFERLPVFLRRLRNNSWQYRLDIESIVPATAASRERGQGRTERREDFGMGMEKDPDWERREPGREGIGAPRPPQPTGTFQPARIPARVRKLMGRETEEEEEVIDLRDFVEVSIRGVAYQFTPLLEKLREKEEANRTVADVGRTTERP